jgi:hypothetical protein
LKTRSAQALRVFLCSLPRAGKIGAFHHSLWIHTMNRCIRALSALSLLAALPLGGMAQTSPTTQVITDSTGTVAVAVRTFPPKALRGTLQVLAPPEVLLDNKVARLSPGARIRGANGMLAMSSSLVGQTVPVVYVLEPQGMLHDVWVLTEVEAKLMPTAPTYSTQ